MQKLLKDRKLEFGKEGDNTLQCRNQLNMDFKNSLTLIARIKARLAEPLPGLPIQLRMAPTFRQQDTHKQHYTKAGVLLLLYERKDGLSVVFMKRPEYEGVHGGQISFPGGKQEI